MSVQTEEQAWPLAWIWRVALIGCLAAPGVGSESQSGPPLAAASGQVAATDLEVFADDFMAREKVGEAFPAAALVVVDDGAIVMARGYGFADLERSRPVSPDATLFYAASNGKLFVATAVMQLVEAGKLGLDDDVNAHLTRFQLDAKPAPAITVRDLLTHTSGLDNRFSGTMVRPGDPIPGLCDYFATATPPRVRPPGDAIAYSNLGVALAGCLVEEVSGEPFDSYVERHIFGPLGMAHTSFRQPLPPELERELVASRRGRPPSIIPFPAGSLAGTVADMAPFLIAHLEAGSFGGRRLLGEDAERELERAQFEVRPGFPVVALGFFETVMNGRRVLYHTGDRGHHSLVFLLPSERLGFYLVAATSDELGSELRQRFAQAFVDRYTPAAPAAPAAESSPPAAAAERVARARRAAGLYRPSGHSLRSFEKVAMLVADFRIEANSDGSLTAHPPWGATRLVESEPWVFRAEDGGWLVFQPDAQGVVSRLSVGGGLSDPGSAERIHAWESGRLHLLLAAVGFLIFLARCLHAPLGWLYRRLRHGGSVAPSVPGQLGWRLSGWTSGLVVSCPLVMLGWALSRPWPVFDVPWSLKLVLTLALAASGLGLPLPVFAIRAWQRRQGTLDRRILLTLVALGSMLMLPWLAYWNLLGYRY